MGLGLGLGSGLGWGSSDPTGSRACAPSPGSSAERTQRPDWRTLRHSTRREESSTSCWPRRCSTSRCTGCLSCSRACTRRASRLKPDAPALGSSGGSGKRRRKVSAKAGSSQYATGRPAKRCAPKCRHRRTGPLVASRMASTNARPPSMLRCRRQSSDAADGDGDAPPCSPPTICWISSFWLMAERVSSLSTPPMTSATIFLRSAKTPDCCKCSATRRRTSSACDFSYCTIRRWL
eukprot:scaffold10770_cov66-Phaeocystis_antarctica.AAC.10